MLEQQYKQLKSSYEKDIEICKDKIYDLRKKIVYAENEIKLLEEDRQKSMTTPKELGYEK